MIGGVYHQDTEENNYILSLNELNIDIRPYFFISLAIEEKSREYIRKIYNKNKWEYFECYKESAYAQNDLLKVYPVDIEETIRMVIGIYEYAEKHKKYKDLLSIVKHSYKFVYRFVENRIMLDEGEFAQQTLKRTGDIQKGVKTYVYSLFVFVFLCYHWKKNFSLSLMGIEFIINLVNTPNTFRKKVELSKKNKTEINKIKEDTTYLSTKNKNTIWKMIQPIMDKQLNGISNPFENNNEKEFKASMTMLAWGDFIESCGMDPIELQTLELTQEEMDFLIQEYLIMNDSYGEILDFDTYIILAAYTYVFVRFYQDVKSKYLDTSEEEKYIFNVAKAKELEEKEAKINKIKEQSEQKIAEEKSMRLATIQENNDLKRKVMLLEKELEEKRANDKELSALRTFVYEMEQEQQTAPSITMEEMKETIQQKNIALFGGHPDWLQKTKEELPSIRFVDVDDINRKLTFLKQVDALFINTDYFNHGFYRKVMKAIAKYDVQLYYVHGMTNKELTIKSMYDKIK